jgi:hypothetical protein
MEKNILPFDLVKTNTIVKIVIWTNSLTLGVSASFRIDSIDNNGTLVKVDNVDISGEEYNGWGSDDNYIVALICSKLGYTPDVAQNSTV